MTEPSVFSDKVETHHTDVTTLPSAELTGEILEISSYRGFCVDEYYVCLQTSYPRRTDEMTASDAIALGMALIRAGEAAKGTDASDSFFPPF